MYNPQRDKWEITCSSETEVPNIQRLWRRSMWIKLGYGRDGILVVPLRTERYDEADLGSKGSDSKRH